MPTSASLQQQNPLGTVTNRPIQRSNFSIDADSLQFTYDLLGWQQGLIARHQQEIGFALAQHTTSSPMVTAGIGGGSNVAVEQPARRTTSAATRHKLSLAMKRRNAARRAETQQAQQPARSRKGKKVMTANQGPS